jgi:regulator of cell morphogenesis and NO signaling
MAELNKNRTVGELVSENSRRAQVFETLGIDYCCGGDKPLEQACQNRGLAVEDVLKQLQAVDAESPKDEQDWRKTSMTELADHIEQTHHVYLRKALPRLTELSLKVRNAHGENHPEVLDVEQVFLGLKAELESHMMKEEQILFPLIRRLELSDTAQSFHCGSVNNPISVMEHEHDNAGQALERLRELTNGYTLPEDGCNTFRALLDGLEELERDLHTHIHKENNILFPRASERESQLAEASS